MTWRRADIASREPIRFRQCITLHASVFREKVVETIVVLDGDTRQVSAIAKLDKVRLSGQCVHEFVVERGDADGHGPWTEATRIPLDVYVHDERVERPS